MNINQALKTALNFEQKGEKAYYETAAKTKNPLVRKTFSYLVTQELNHIAEIKEYMKKNKVKLGGDKPIKTKTFFSSAIKAFKRKLELSKNDLEARDVALKLEQNAYDYYKKQKESVTDAKLKGLFSLLMSQENAHYILIDNIFKFMKDPEQFLMDQEKRLFEG